MVTNPSHIHPTAPPADTDLRDRLRYAIANAWRANHCLELVGEPLDPDEFGSAADAVLAVLPAPADRATEWRAAAIELDSVSDQFDADNCTCGDCTICTWKEAANHLRRKADEAQPAEPEAPVWRGATEVASDREIAARAAAGLVGYRQDNGRLLHCLAHRPAPASRHADFHEVGADDLDDGGICVHWDCGRDLLATWPTPADEEQQP